MFLCERGDLILEGVAHHAVDSLDILKHFGGDLGVAAGNHDEGLRVISNGFSHGLPRLHGCFLSHRA